MSNLFSALHKYFQREDQSPRENQITEMLAQVLKHEAGFRNLLFEKWFGKLCIPSKVLITTQKAIHLENLTKYIDLMIEDDSDDDRSDLLLVAELKWDSGPSCSSDSEGKPVDQTDNYEEYINTCGACDPDDIPRLYLAKIDISRPGKWRSKRWADLYNLGHSYLSKLNPASLTFGQGLLREFLTFLEEEGIPETPLELTDIAHLQLTAAVFNKVQEELTKIANGLPKKLRIDFTSGGGPVLRLARQLQEQGRYVLYSTSPNFGQSASFCFGICPKAEHFRVGEDLPSGIPLAAMWFDCKPRQDLWKKLHGSQILSELCDQEIVPRWQKNTLEDSWVVCYRVAPILDLHSPGSIGERIAAFFDEGFRTFEKIGLIEELTKEFPT